MKTSLNNLQWQLLFAEVDSAFPLHTRCLREARFPEHVGLPINICIDSEAQDLDLRSGVPTCTFCPLASYVLRELNPEDYKF